MWKRVGILIAGGLIALAVQSEPAEAQRMRCGFYAGMGYRCFGTAGGTGGRIFRQMDYNTRRCGYFNPGCVSRARVYRAPVVGYGRPIYRAPVIGYTRRVTAWGYARPRVGAGYVRPSAGGYVRPTVGPGYRRPGTF
ncbi:MAG TPA: hypothetical protein VIH40_08290 [Xanthobacteraceae bacterium]